MTTLQFLAEWAVRSSLLILSGALLLWVLRVKDPSLRLTAWTAMLCGSLAIPVFAVALPKVPLTVLRISARHVESPAVAVADHPATNGIPVVLREVDRSASRNTVAAKRFEWVGTAVTLYALIAGTMLLRLLAGLTLSLRLLRQSRSTTVVTDGIEIRESDRVPSPVTLGIICPAIVLPGDWHEWDATKLRAVLAHESSHIRRYDPAVQLLSATHRALLWYNPLNWFLHRSIVRVAEEVSDDAAISVTCDRASYAETLLGFMQRGVRGTSWQGVPMARYERPDKRISRILDTTTLSRGITRWSLATILVLGMPLAYLAASAQPQSAPRPVPAPHVDATATLGATVQADTPQSPFISAARPQSAPEAVSATQVNAVEHVTSAPPPPVETQTITVLHPEAAGIELIGSQSPEFQTSLEAVVGPQFSQLGAWLPYTAVLKNNSPQAVVAFEIVYPTVGRGFGRIASPSNETGPRRGTLVLNPGTAIVVMPSFFVLTKSISASTLANMELERHEGELLALQKERSVTISLDSVVLASGQFVGPDTAGLFPDYVASFTAWRAVDLEVQSDLATGKTFDAIAADLSHFAETFEVTRKKPHRDWTLEDYNAEVSATQARLLLKRYQIDGAQIVKDLVQQQLEQPDILVHR